MSSIYSLIDEREKSLKRLEQLRTKAENEKKQTITDQKFEGLSKEVYVLAEILRFSKQNFSFNVDSGIVNNFYTVLTGLQRMVENGEADEEVISDCEKKIKNVKSAVKTAWQKYYPMYVAETVSTLNIISGLNSAGVKECLENINAAANWDNSLIKFQKLKNGMLKAENLIAELKLDEEIIIFLRNMNSGKASLASLNNKVQQWLKAEMLESRIKLSFM